MTGHNCERGHRHGHDAPADIRVLIVDDHPGVRDALAELIADEQGITVVGECRDGSEVVAAAQRLHPDVVLMDLSMPVMNGFDAAGALRGAQSDARVVVLTGADATPSEAASAGAHALVPKHVPGRALLHCLRTVVGGGCCPYCL